VAVAVAVAVGWQGGGGAATGAAAGAAHLLPVREAREAADREARVGDLVRPGQRLVALRQPAQSIHEA
jgi:hypothetical protein